MVKVKKTVMFIGGRENGVAVQKMVYSLISGNVSCIIFEM